MVRKRVRLSIELPADHGILRYPPGVRAVIAREWLDIGGQLAGIRGELQELREAINALTFTSNRVQEKRIVEPPAPFAPPAQPQQPEVETHPKIDVNGFLSRLGVFEEKE